MLPEGSPPRRWLATVWLLLFLVCCGLGYPSLNRYDPRTLVGTSDAAEYHRLVTGRGPRPPHVRPRVLVPLMARPVFLAAEGRVGSWEPAFLGLLLMNSLFCSLTALIVVVIGASALGDPEIGLLGAFLFLANFAVPNLFLSGGYVDAGEGFGLAALALILSSGRWPMLPLLAALGVLVKETFVPLSAVFSLAWWWCIPGRQRPALATWLAVMQTTGLATVTVLWSFWHGRLVPPWEIAAEHISHAGFLAGLAGNLRSHELAYVFAWPLALGIWRLHALPRPWVIAGLSTAAAALAMSALDNGLGNAVRPMYSAVGPVLCLSVAEWLTHPTDGHRALDQVR